jgi:AraC family transcriptional regulator, regulatory protein of adaptative response / methylated-DNA-[protein]-cysteine methyltransferase
MDHDAIDKRYRELINDKYGKAPVIDEISYAAGNCEMGALLVAKSALGLCALFIGSRVEGLVEELRSSFPTSKLIEDQAGLREDVSKVTAFVDTPSGELALPLDMRGTAFQLQVWNALREIPAGTSVTYAELAQRVGKPDAVLAVAAACVANTIAIAIPCHRVIRSDGEVSGYRWGVERKQSLLKKEAAI